MPKNTRASDVCKKCGEKTEEKAVVAGKNIFLCSTCWKAWWKVRNDIVAAEFNRFLNG